MRKYQARFLEGRATARSPGYSAKTRRGSYGGNVSGYADSSLSPDVATRVLSRVQHQDHPDHGLAPSSLRPPCIGWFHECRQPRLAPSRVPRQGSSPTYFRITREGLEPDEGKLSRPVLRGLAPSNGGRLLGVSCGSAIS